MPIARRPKPLLTDEQEAKLEPLLPPLPAHPKGGRPWCDHRRVLEGILRILKTGAPWCELPGAYPSPSTCWRRLQRYLRNEDVDRYRALIKELGLRG